MNCQQLQDRIDDLLDGELSELERHEAEQHLDGCADCRRSVATQREVVDAVRALPRGIAPRDDLFRGVRSAIAAGSAGEHTAPRGRKGGGGRVWLALAAAVAIVVVAGIYFRSVESLESSGAPEQPASLTEALMDFRDAQREYVEAADLLMQALDSHRAALTPEATAVLEENLQAINKAIGQVELALKKNPQDPSNQQVLTALHQRKVKLLWRVSRLSQI